jgi:hypothetical protein
MADLARSPGTDPVYFPQFGDGGGYTTTVILLNTSDKPESGTLQFGDDSGSPSVLHPVGGDSNAIFNYSIPAGGIFRLQTDGAPAKAGVGWVKLIPDPSTSTPVGLEVFSFNPETTLVSESGIPATGFVKHARVYFDLSKNHNTGLALCNPGDVEQTITLSAYQKDGTTNAVSGGESLKLGGNKHISQFASQYIPGLPSGFTGVFDISSDLPFAALTMRFLNNERSDFLMSAFPIADPSRADPSPVLFPQIADGGNYATEFIFLSPSEPSSIILGLIGETGTVCTPAE